jgi:pyroglutamyl-peptidase
MKVLLSGFSSFSHHTVNSSEVLAFHLANRKIPGLEMRSCILSVTFNDSFNVLKDQIDLYQPEVVISLGLAEKRSVISLEKVALNYVDCEIPDNSGRLIKDSPVLGSAPAAYFSTLPLKEMLQVETPYPVEISYSAGTYVCNDLMFRALHYLKDKNIQAGFIHVPVLKNNQEIILDSLQLMLSKLLQTQNTK